MKRSLLIIGLLAAFMMAFSAFAPSTGVKVAGVTVAKTDSAEAFQAGVDTRNGRAWIKTSVREIVVYGASAVIAGKLCGGAARVPYVGIVLGLACTKAVGAALVRVGNDLYRRYRGRNIGIWAELGRCSSGKTRSLCMGTY
ncbi:MAG: hypothetical protein M9938_06845 [Solirubrobacterales bacterium]|nr:hypothetical protein [Solirubrobacterales bacterium]